MFQLIIQQGLLFTTCLLYSWTVVLYVINWCGFCHSTQKLTDKSKLGQEKSPNQVPAYKTEQDTDLNNVKLQCPIVNIYIVQGLMWAADSCSAHQEIPYITEPKC
jgi:hypothetical protein